MHQSEGEHLVHLHLWTSDPRDGQRRRVWGWLVVAARPRIKVESYDSRPVLSYQWRFLPQTASTTSRTYLIQDGRLLLFFDDQVGGELCDLGLLTAFENAHLQTSVEGFVDLFADGS